MMGALMILLGVISEFDKVGIGYRQRKMEEYTERWPDAEILGVIWVV